MTPLLAVKKLVKIPFQDFYYLDDRATRSENKWKMCRFVIYINKIAENLRPPIARMNRSVHYQRRLHT